MLAPSRLQEGRIGFFFYFSVLDLDGHRPSWLARILGTIDSGMMITNTTDLSALHFSCKREVLGSVNDARGTSYEGGIGVLRSARVDRHAPRLQGCRVRPGI